MKRALLAASVILLALALGLALRTWVIGAVRVAGTSMSGTLVSGDVALVLRAPFEPRRGDVVECRFPGRGDTYIKRVIGLPGETIAFENGGLRVNGVETPEPWTTSPTDDYRIQLGAGEYLVLGDNRLDSYDSRMPDMGPIGPDGILGRVRAILWPPTRWGVVK